MADWRDRNAVPDSEDEEEILSFDSNLSHGQDAARRDEDKSRFQVVQEYVEKEKEGRQTIAVVIPAARKIQINDSDPTKPVLGLGNKSGDDDDDIDELQQDHVTNASTLRVPENLHHLTPKKKAIPVGSGLGEENIIQSNTSSPLSSISPSDLGLEEIFESSSKSGQRPISIPSQQTGLERSSSDGLLVERNFDAATLSRSAPRSLRPRNPLQLHPYAIESERYKQTLRGRGLQPLRIVQNEMQGDESEVSGTEEQDSYPSPNRSNQHVRSRSQNSTSLPQPAFVHDLSPPRGLQETSSNLEEEEFPDLSALLREPLPRVARNGFKKVKISHTYAKQGRHLQKESGPRPLLASPKHDELLSHGQPNDPFNIPLSPPTSAMRSSSSDAIVQSKAHFRMPPGLITPQLQTPIPSSETQHLQIHSRHHDNVSHVHSSDSEPVRLLERRHPRVTSDDELDLPREQRSDSEPGADAIGSSEASETEDTQLYKVQRKIRGVLPASWLRLDMKNGARKAQGPGTRKEPEASESPERDRNLRGVARPVSRSHVKDPLSTKSSTILISDESSPERDGYASVRQQSPRISLNSGLLDASNSAQNLSDWPDTDSMEDNRIDDVLQPASRTTAKSKRPKPRQTLLSFSGESLRVRKKHKPKQNQINSWQRARANLTQSRTKLLIHSKMARVSKPRLGILDIAGAQGKASQPDFMKVAVRSARSRQDLGRQSPSKKFLRLATREDTADVQATLTSWRNGSLSRRRKLSMPTSDARIPLNATSGNARPHGHPRGHGRLSKAAQHTLREMNPILESPSSKMEDHVGKVIQTILSRQRNQWSNKIQTHSGMPNPLPRVSTARALNSHISSSLHTRESVRPALLENLATRGNRTPVGPHSYKTPRPLITTTANPNSNPILDRFLQETALDHQVQFDGETDGIASHLPGNEALAKTPIHKPRIERRHRKQRPKQLDIRKPFFHKAIEIDDDFAGVGVAPLVEHGSSAKSTLLGLGPYGTEYSLDFGIEPQLPVAHFWKPLTDRNSELKRTFDTLKQRNLEKAAEEVELDCFGKKWKWGGWTESLSTDLSEIFGKIASVIHSCSEVNIEDQHLNFTKALHALNSISLFFARNLCFLDHIDRVVGVKHTLTLIKILLEALREGHGLLRETAEPVAQSRKFLRGISTGLVNLATHIKLISAHEIVPMDVQETVKAMLDRAFGDAMEWTFSPNLKETWLHVRQSQDLSIYRHDKDSQAVCINDLLHFAVNLRLERLLHDKLCKIFSDSHKAQLHDVRAMEGVWRDVFTLLPFLQKTFGSEDGSFPPLERDVQLWVIINRFIEPVLESYRLDSRSQAPTFNSYLRTIIGRCLKLVQQWSWRKPEAILGTFFDFFAHNSLANLEHERSHGSHQFLQRLQEDTVLDFMQRDTSFHIYLKLLGAGLKSMRNDYPPKKIGGIAWRYMPNHGRNLPKDQSIRQEDLDALRNHHDLLCVLYWASPHDFRPRVTSIQNLVQIESSHREACHISIRSWSNLVRYQLSTDEPLTKLEPFAKWISDILSQVLHLHNLARSEVESQAKAVEQSGLSIISPDDRELMISRNQRQVEAVLEDATIQLTNAIVLARTGQAAHALFCDPLLNILEMFDAKLPRTNTVIVQALNVYSAITQKFVSEQGEPESQNYGEWPTFEDENQGPTSAFLEKLLSPVQRLLSNSFGADDLPEESLLTKLVDAWTAIVHLAVSQGTMSWNDVFGLYSTYSWNSLRDTEQTRKYTPYALASLIKKDKDLFKEHEESIYKAWLASCLDRDSMLKFQHLLTAEIFKVSNTNPLFNNVQSKIRGRYEQCTKSVNEFRSNRGGLLSLILAIMRENLDYRNYHELGDRGKLKQDFVNLIKHMMSTMKANYRGLGNSSNVRGAYVNFVHAVVGLLQQHTADICPIDRFFVDSPDFPAPSTDPAYVVDRILNYVHRCKDDKSSKQLASLVQNLCERAVIDDKVEELVDQLEQALHLNGRDDYATKERLLNFMVHTILPVYVDIAFTTRCGWLFVEPLLLAMRGAFTFLVSWVDISSKESVENVCLVIREVLGVTYRNMVNWIVIHRDIPTHEWQPSRAFSISLRIVTALLPLLNYLYRSWPKSDLAKDTKDIFLKIKRTVRHYKRVLYADSNDEDMLDPGSCANADISRPQYDYVPAFVLRELKSALSERWQERGCENGSIYTRSNSRAEWVKVADGYGQDADGFLDDFREFNMVLAGLEGLHEGGHRDDEDFGEASRGDDGWDWRDEAPCF